jgi:hypothetical protein
MRSMKFVFAASSLAVAMTVPCSALAASTYTDPLSLLSSTRSPRPQTVVLNLASRTGQTREIRVGHEMFRLHAFEKLSLVVPVGSTVLVYSDQDSKIQGVPLLQVAAGDSQRTVEVR